MGHEKTTVMGLVLAGSVTMITAAQGVDPNVIVVDRDTPAACADQEGDTWPTAFEFLQDALQRLAIDETKDTIWIAQGVYYPDIEYDQLCTR